MGRICRKPNSVGRSGGPGQVHRELDLHLGVHAPAAHLQEPADDRGQGEEVALEDGGEADQAHPGPGDAVVDRVVLGGVGGGHEREGAVGLGHVETEPALPGERVGAFADVSQLERQEVSLGDCSMSFDGGEVMTCRG